MQSPKTDVLVTVLLAFVVLSLVSSVPSQESGWEERLRDGHFFANRVINIWNSLPDHIVASPSVACFKRKLSKMNFNE